MTEYVERLILYPGALQVLDFADGKVRLVGVRALKGGLLVGHRLMELPQHLPQDRCARRRHLSRRQGHPPDGETVIEDGDEVFFLAATSDIKRVMSELRRIDDPVRRVVIAGAGNIGYRLAKALEKTNQVKLIERDTRRARRVSELLENTIVLNGDAADEELLIEENIDSADVFAALTNSEEANILSAMLAKRLGANKVMALINKPSYAELMESGSIDVAISPQTVTIGSLLAHVRRGDVVRVHSLRRGAAEALEAIVHGDERTSRVVGRKVEEIRLPEGTSIGAIVRGEDVIMAHHDYVVQSDDHLILFLSDRRHTDAVEKLFLRAYPLTGACTASAPRRARSRAVAGCHRLRLCAAGRVLAHRGRRARPDVPRRRRRDRRHRAAAVGRDALAPPRAQAARRLSAGDAAAGCSCRCPPRSLSCWRLPGLSFTRRLLRGHVRAHDDGLDGAVGPRQAACLDQLLARLAALVRRLGHHRDGRGYPADAGRGRHAALSRRDAGHREGGEARAAYRRDRPSRCGSSTASSRWPASSGCGVCGMSWFDAICHAFSAVGLGGFSTHDASIAYFNSPAIELVLSRSCWWRL